MLAPHEKMRAFGETWVASESTMHDLRQGTSSSLYVEELKTNPLFHEKTFAVAGLEHGH